MVSLEYKQSAQDTAYVQRAIQAKAEHKDTAGREISEKPGTLESKKSVAVQAEEYPELPLCAQHLAKSDDDFALELHPIYNASSYKGSEKFKGKVALITGGDSGIGRSVAVLYAREGADVAIAYLSEHQDAENTKAMVEAEGGKCILIAGDVCDRAFCFEAVKRTVEALGRLDILVNNAAFQLHAENFEDITEERLDKTLKTNLYGYFHMAQAAAPHLPNGGSIINTGSVTAFQGAKYLVDYSLTKGGIHAFTRSLSGHLLPKGIRVNAVAPGPVWTPLNPADSMAEEVAQFGTGVPMKRPAQPEEMAPAYVFLASPQMSSYITGEILPVIGGY